MDNVKSRLWNANYIKAWGINFMIHFAFTLIVPLLPLYLSETFGAGKQTIGICLAGYTVMTLLVRPFGGFLVDGFSRKKVLVIFSVLFACVFGGYLFAGTLLVFTVFRTLHGLPFGILTVSANTVAIDVLPSDRRSEGIGYYGLSNNLATVIGPASAIFILNAAGGDFKVLFWLSTVFAALAVVLAYSMKMPVRPLAARRVVSADRFFLLKGWPVALALLPLATAHGIVQTYVAIYGKEELGMITGTGFFFTLFAIGLILSRLTGSRALRRNLISRNATLGVIVSLFGYLLFASVHSPIGYYGSAFIIGLGNGHMWPAFQSMFINLTDHHHRGTAVSSILTAWDAGVGLGILSGGICAQHFGYGSTFWVAFAVDAVGILIYLFFSRGYFERNKLV
ncbi:MAG: MFS transporter [Bacteroidales bacterium]|nr:MFS transporter [Bacteroidales bacterium]